ncbi:MAG: ABC transporter ATP-binding protein [Chloroflexota bacterium]|nr:ABC transporter ATP-binding protein [Chloroflexota bacterium]
MSDIMIEFRNLTKRYGTLLANDHVNLQVKRGELMTLLCPSGCGKTTALRGLTGYVKPDEGQILIDDKDVTNLPTHQRQLGMVFQNFALFPHMTVWDNVRFPLMIRGMSKQESESKVREALQVIRLEGLSDRYPRQLSGGQQQRVGLARALVYRPNVLLLDEPLSNLDAKLREEMRFEIRDLQRRLGITAIYVTHDQQEALALSDRVAIMNNGRLEQVGTPEEIYEHPRSKFVADFIGLSDFIPASVESITGSTAQIKVGTTALSAPAVEGLRRGQKVLLFIRPNAVVIKSDAKENVLDGEIRQATYLGDRMDYRVQIGDGIEARVQTDGTQRYATGERVRLYLPPERCRLIVEE